MTYLKFPKRPPQPLTKPFFTVGEGLGCDASTGKSGDRIVFTLQIKGNVVTCLPGQAKLRVNGKAVFSPTPLLDGDRLTWEEHSCVFLESPLSEAADAQTEGTARTLGLEILQRLAADLEGLRGPQFALQEALRALVGFAGAEEGHLVTDLSAGGDGAPSWEWIAAVNEQGAEIPRTPQAQWMSNTILNDAVRRRAPVYIESLVGHPWAGQASLIGARVDSIAALPLCLGSRVLGCVSLYTRTPGRRIRETRLAELGLAATQMALLVALKTQERSVRALSRKTSSPRRLLFHPASPMAELDSRLTRLAASDLSLLILGETGVGKELVAREIHARSPAARGPFVAVNCGAIPPSLMESTLFGHAKGAFTGADRDQPGKILQARGGVLFLDEIGDLPLELQVKLLRVLAEKKVEPVGGSRAFPVEFRVVCATHQDLPRLIASGKFRQDLFYRLNGASLQVPPLRARAEDIGLLAEAFLRERSEGLSLSEAARRALLAHAWPGNVRELEQAISRAAALVEGAEIAPKDLELVGDGAPLSSALRALGETGDESLREAQLRFTHDYVREVLARFDGVRARAAAALGISERTLYRILASDSVDSHV